VMIDQSMGVAIGAAKAGQSACGFSPVRVCMDSPAGRPELSFAYRSEMSENLGNGSTWNHWAAQTKVGNVPRGTQSAWPKSGAVPIWDTARSVPKDTRLGQKISGVFHRLPLFLALLPRAGDLSGSLSLSTAFPRPASCRGKRFPQQSPILHSATAYPSNRSSLYS
jgi:hypothetical protein